MTRDHQPPTNGAARPDTLPIGPADIDAEQVILGTALMTPSTVPELRDIVTAQAFLRPAHQDLWDLLVTTYDAGNPVTAENALIRLRSTSGHPTIPGVDGPYLAELLHHATAPAAAAEHARRVTDTAQLRAIAERGNTLAARALAPDADPVELGHAMHAWFEEAFNAHQAAADPHLIDGATFIYAAADDQIPAIWGRGDDILWAEGEPLIIAGPPGVGKTTLGQQVTLARCGVRDTVLGYPITPTRKKVLYLASDRPRQAARSFARMVTAADRDKLEQALTVWKGPPPADLAKNTHMLVDLAHQAGADTIVLDSLKDMAIKLSDDEVGAAVNQGIQRAVAEGIDVLALHHYRKRDQTHGGKEPTSVDEMYGSTWIAAGAGSILSIWGQAGDLVVSMRHLKQPAAEIGPYQLVHNHDAGLTDIYHQVDLVELTRRQRSFGLSVKLAAATIFAKGENDPEPTRNEIKKAQRRLDKLVADGVLVKHSPERLGPGQEARYFVAAPEPDGNGA